MIKQLLDKTLNGTASLGAQLASDAGLLEAGLVNQGGQGQHPGRRSESQQEPERVGQGAALFPERVNRDDYLRIGASRVRNQQA